MNSRGSRFLIKARFIACPLLLLAFGATGAQTTNDFVVISAKVDQTMNPKSVTETALECVKNAACKAALDAGAAMWGIEGSLVTSLAATITTEKKGEESWVGITLPTGYEYCRSAIRTVSVVPATGNRASYMGVSADKPGLSVYTWTPKRNITEGRTWIEADFVVTGVKTDVAQKYRESGKCNANALPRTVVACRGASGVNNGVNHCGTYND
jgi:hypothetical protein